MCSGEQSPSMLKVGIHKPQRETMLRLDERGLGDGGWQGMEIQV